MMEHNDVLAPDNVENTEDGMNCFRYYPVFCPGCKRHLVDGEWVLPDGCSLFCSPVCKVCGSHCAVYQEIEMVPFGTDKTIKKYKCSCGYVYDPEVGVPKHGIAPRTAFEDLPEDWKCPICSMNKEVFKEV